jgi:hypothetical protein
MAGPIPVEFVFNPNWWFRNYGISFEQPFYFDRCKRIENDVKMRRVLYERLGLGSPNPEPRPIIGSRHVAGGFVVPALLGLQIRFAKDAAPWPLAGDLSREEVLALKAPDIERTWPMDQLIADVKELTREYGYVVGDFNTDGVLNCGTHLRGQRLFIDFFEDPELVHHLFGVVTETIASVAKYVRSVTGTCSIAVNRSIVRVDSSIFLHAACSLEMISPATYEQYLLPYEKVLAKKLAPYGIHHCAGNLHTFSGGYSEVPVVFFDVGWGSDMARCREAFPDAFLNLRLNPVRMLQLTPEEIRRDTERLLKAEGATDRVGICCINMDYGTPDENLLAVLKVAEEVHAADTGKSRKSSGSGNP